VPIALDEILRVRYTHQTLRLSGVALPALSFTFNEPSST
jgi:hypothetical protein